MIKMLATPTIKPPLTFAKEAPPVGKGEAVGLVAVGGEGEDTSAGLGVAVGRGIDAIVVLFVGGDWGFVVLKVVLLPKTLRGNAGFVVPPIWNEYFPHPESVAISPRPVILLPLEPHLKENLLKFSTQVACSQPVPSKVKVTTPMTAVGDWFLQKLLNDVVNVSILVLLKPTRQFGSAAATREIVAMLDTRRVV